MDEDLKRMLGDDEPAPRKRKRGNGAVVPYVRPSRGGARQRPMRFVPLADLGMVKSEFGRIYRVARTTAGDEFDVRTARDLGSLLWQLANLMQLENESMLRSIEDLAAARLKERKSGKNGARR